MHHINRSLRLANKLTETNYILFCCEFSERIPEGPIKSLAFHTVCFPGRSKQKMHALSTGIMQRHCAYAVLTQLHIQPVCTLANLRSLND